ncbi:hypothetical protein [uncultured Alistipes sp.]|uniref:hypothetical protein n=1 Tax=uncultured Alistipes sp. TaxID=538949 RepID=UPI0026305E2F|nr:hypothetical protein [uncultured Alistipes sp.]
MATELRNRSVDGDTPREGNFSVPLGLSFQIEQDAESAFCYNSESFEIHKSIGVIRCREKTQKTEPRTIKVKFGKITVTGMETHFFRTMPFHAV